MEFPPSASSSVLASSPTLRHVVDVLDVDLRPVGALEEEVLERPFVGVQLWHPGADPGTAFNRILLVPMSLRLEDAAALITAIQCGAAAVILKTSDSDIAVLPPEVRALGFILDERCDWVDTAMLLRSLCAHEIARQTLGLRRGDLFSLAQTLAALAGGAVSIVDSAGRVMGYSTLPGQPIDDVRRESTLALREAESPLLDADHVTLARSRVARWFPPRLDMLGRAALPVRAQGELLGSVWLIALDEVEGLAGCTFLDSVSSLVAHHMLEARAASSAEHVRSSDLMRTLAENATHRGRAADELGLREGVAYQAVAFSVLDSPDGDRVLFAYRLLHRIEVIARSLFGWSHTAILGEEVLCLIRSEVADLPREFAARVQGASPEDVAVGLGPPRTGLEAIARSMSQAVAIVRLLRVSSPPGAAPPIAGIDSMRERLGLAHLTRVLDQTGLLEEDSVARVVAHDATHGTEFVRTLTAYVNTFGNVRETALALHTHQNTVRYRLDVLRKELGVDLSVPHLRLWVWMRLWALESVAGDPSQVRR